jgi:hypothetical protein
MKGNRAGVAAAGGALAAAVVTCVTSLPAPLPAIALGSDVLLHVERGLATLGGYLVLLVVLSRAWNGQLPTEFSTQGLKYASDRTFQGLDLAEAEAARARDERLMLLRRIEALEREAYRGVDD